MGGRLVLPILPLVYVALIKLLTEINLKPKLLAIITVGAVSSLVLGYLFDPYVANHANKWRVYFERRQKAGTYLQENYPSGTLVALNSAGIIPYYSKLPTIDMLGLNDVHIAHKGKRDLDLNYAHQAGDGVYVLSREPDIILLGAIASQKPAFFISDQEIWNSPQFEDNYELATWPTVGYAYVRKE